MSNFLRFMSCIWSLCFCYHFVMQKVQKSKSYFKSEKFDKVFQYSIKLFNWITSKTIQDAERNDHAPAGAVRQPDRFRILEKVVQGTRHLTRRNPRRARHRGPRQKRRLLLPSWRRALHPAFSAPRSGAPSHQQHHELRVQEALQPRKYFPCQRRRGRRKQLGLGLRSGSQILRRSVRHHRQGGRR